MDVAVSYVLDENYQTSKEFYQFLASHLSFIYEESIDPELTSKQYYRDIFVHYGIRYDLYNFQKEMKLIFPLKIYETGEFSFLYEKTKQCFAENPLGFQFFFEEVAKRFKMNLVYQIEFPERAGKSILSILHLTEVSLHKFPHFTPSILKKFMLSLGSILCWPDPIGEFCTR